MKLLNPFTVLVGATAFFSCKKDYDSPAPPVTPPDAIKHISTIYLASATQISYDSLKNFELIISEPGGKVLLDTVAALNTQLNADLKTGKNTLDMTVVVYDASAHYYRVIAEKSVDPSAWAYLPGSDSLIGTPPSTGGAPTPFQDTIIYTHVPVANWEPYIFTQYTGGSGTQYINNGSNTITESYYRYPNTYAYLLFTNAGLYNLHLIRGHDIVDISHMDTAVRRNFTVPAGMKKTAFYAYGYPDSTDLTQPVMLNFFNVTNLYKDDLIYPGRKTFQKYNWGLYLQDTVNRINVNYINNWCDTVNMTPFLPDAGYLTVNSTRNNNFSVQFNSRRPGYYATQWNATGFTLVMNASADSTTLDPLGYLTALKAKLLAGQDLSTMKLNDLYFSYGLDHDQPVTMGLSPLSRQYVPVKTRVSTVTLYKYFN
jgi:hypothetical protein